MEGPSLFLAARQLAPFKGKTLSDVFGNTKTIAVERLANKAVKDIFSWGKHLVFQFDSFALRVHFLMFGTFEATVDDKSVTGDYKRKAREPRLAFVFKNGHIEMYSCSVKWIESAAAQSDYDFSVDLMSKHWNGARALKQMLEHPKHEVADVLLDQTIFAGLGNIIKNEILFLARIQPNALVRDLPRAKLKELVDLAKSFSIQFYEWRKDFVLRKNLKIYRKINCPVCGRRIIRAKTGTRQRWSYYCPFDQKSPPTGRKKPPRNPSKIAGRRS
jgi:endonuclease-8